MSDPARLVREVTEDEIEAFQTRGWVFLPQYLNVNRVAEMLRFLEDHLGIDGQGELERGPLAEATTFVEAGFWRDWRFLARDAHVEPFRSICMASEMGRNAYRLMGRDVGVRFDVDGVLLKVPQDAHLGSRATDWHQDWPNQSHDRVGGMSFWIALSEVPPKRGGLRFLTGSHREGPLGRTLRGGTDLVEQYPELVDRYETVGPLHYCPGDASVHSGLTVHSAPPNESDTPRWAYAMTCFPADACYTGAAFSNTDGLGLEVGKPLDHPRFALLFDPNDSTTRPTNRTFSPDLAE
jgi:hypothetical protein